MKMKDLFCTLSLFLGLLALPLPSRAQHPDSLLREAAARDQQVRMRLLEMNRRVNGGEYSAALVDSLVAAGAEMERIDRENMRLVASLLRDGLPEGLAAESYDAVWLIIDHAPLKEQKRYLPLLREAAGRGVISAYKLATLEDRVAMYEERPQRCGTQSYQTNVGGETVIYIWPVAHPERLDSLRGSIGTCPMAEYVRLLEETSGARVVYDPALTVDSLKRIVGRKALF